MRLLVPGLHLRAVSAPVEDAGADVNRTGPAVDQTSTSPGGDRWAVELIRVNRRFGASRVLTDLSLQIPWDQRIAVLGPNGAGKTSLLRIVATLARPDSGTVVVGGLRLPDQAAAVRRHVGFVAHQTFLYDDLTIRENLRFYGKLYGVPNASTRIEQVIGPLGLAYRANDRVRALSRGLQQRAALARAILHDPAILLLDEPDTGLDVAGTDVLQSLFFDSSGRRRTVLLTSHNLGRALDLVDRVVVIDGGRLVLDVPSCDTSTAVVEACLRRERLAP